MLKRILKSVVRVVKIALSVVYFLLAIVGVIALNDPYFVYKLKLPVEYWLLEVAPMLHEYIQLL